MRIPSTRWSAAAAHLVLSGLVIGTIALAAFVNLFPAGLHHAAKLDRLLGVMLMVDIVAGPLLTLILYRRGKPGLRFDLTMIALLQILFLAYGLSTLWRSRPLFLVGSQQAFALVFANEVADDAEAKAKAHHWPRFQGSGPWLVGVDLSSPVAREEFLFAYMAGDAGPLRATSLFVPFSTLGKSIAEKARALGPDVPADGMDRNKVRSMPLMTSRTRNAVVLIDATTGAPVRVVELVKPRARKNQ
jgi:hypothetical protein